MEDNINSTVPKLSDSLLGTGSRTIKGMNPAIKALWVAELRNPEIKQTGTCLRDGKGFCCLGVLTDLYCRSDANVNKYTWDISPGEYEFTFQGEEATLPEAVVEWAGLTDCSPLVPATNINPTNIPNALSSIKGSYELAGLNDAGMSFADIADLIEAAP